MPTNDAGEVKARATLDIGEFMSNFTTIKSAIDSLQGKTVQIMVDLVESGQGALAGLSALSGSAAPAIAASISQLTLDRAHDR